MSGLMQVTPEQVRRLFVVKQQLAQPQLEATPAGLRTLLRAIRCLQLDPIRHVERTHLLVLFSRLGPFDPALFEQLRWDERFVFEYFAHAASMVLTEDYPIFAAQMNHYRNGGFRPKTREWIAANDSLKERVLAQLTAEGPLTPKAFDGEVQQKWVSTGWTNNKNTNQMLDILLCLGDVMVTQRVGNTRYWDLTERFLPGGATTEPLSLAAAVTQGTELALKALGVATPTQIQRHFIRGWHRKLRPDAYAKLVETGQILPVEVVDDSGPWKGTWYVHRDDLPRLEQLKQPYFAGRTTLLSPFDNLICDRDRTEQLFNFRYRIEIYVPKAKRAFGYYVLPILHNDNLIGRIDAKMDRKQNVLRVATVYAQAGWDANPDVAPAVADALRSLASFLDAASLEVHDVPPAWQAIHANL